MARHFAFESQALAVRRQQKLNRRGTKANPMIQPLDLVGRIDSCNRQHRDEDLRLGDGGGIAGEERFDIERLVGLDDEMHAIARNVDARHVFDDFVHLRDDHAVLEGGSFDHGRGVFRVRTGVQIALAIRAHRGN